MNYVKLCEMLQVSTCTPCQIRDEKFQAEMNFLQDYWNMVLDTIYDNDPL